ncbi:hypothetical protein AX14_008475 [Amanita brunnescens Koide BX004]|nr:hypothetical protein AX14_008475 [Amanita brunnescens Koide BX004]
MHRPDPLENNPKAVVTQLSEENLTFIHRPPPTAPSPYSLTTAPASPLLWQYPTPPDDTPLPPVSRARLYKPQPERLPEEDVEKIRQLRRSDPETYTRQKLAQMFGCTQTFVGAVAGLKKSLRKKVIRKEAARFERQREAWSEQKVTARAIRGKRRELW